MDCGLRVRGDGMGIMWKQVEKANRGSRKAKHVWEQAIKKASEGDMRCGGREGEIG